MNGVSRKKSPGDDMLVAERIVAQLTTLGVSGHLWEAIQHLTTTELVERCQAALTELEAISTEAPSIALERGVAQALFATCWMLVQDPALKRELRAGLLEIARIGTSRIAVRRAKTVELVRRVLQERQ